MNTAIAESAPARSNFVTVVAWIFIVLGGLATFIAVLENVVVHTLFPFEQMRKMAAEQPNTPALAVWMVDHLRLLLFVFLLVSAVGLAAAVGLLRRREWARWAMIVLLGLGIVWNVGGLVAQFFMTPQAPDLSKLPSDVAAELESMQTTFTAFGAIMTLGFSVLYGWIIRRLASSEIRAEFS